MGNYLSCTLSAQSGKHCRSPKVVFPGGEIRRLDGPAKAAELMLETPNFFLVNSQSLRVGQRFSALNADDDLEAANVYVMFPMNRLNSFVTTADKGALFRASNSVAKRASSGMVRILPESESVPPPADEQQENEKPLPKLNLEDIEDQLSALELKHRVSIGRAKRPLLETIAEEHTIAR
ncbi:uncharacterized protein LOC131152393 [Malania oleifera]|uniref:uncharacterized protein LOC131152393 n=1 Tax=Malania oleifera TaxID=397392 RepID=UPI0025AD9D57|nr:uncharacterized protein LOC131152393 [Malania oleifera]